MEYKELVKTLQREMNAAGALPKLGVDGDPGIRTRGQLLNFNVVELKVKRIVKAEPVIVPPTPVFAGPDAAVLAELQKMAPHVFFCMTMLGWDEVTHDKQLTKLCWSQTDDARGLKSVIGRSNAWCSGLWCGVNHAVGMPHTRDATASSWRGFGVECDYVFGAFIPMRHDNGSNHICVFLWWIDKKRRIAACLGGNQGNRVSIAAYNLSGNKNGHDEVMPSPRAPKGWKMPAAPYQPAGWIVGTKLGASTR